MTATVEQGYAQSARVARRSASSFYWSFWLLPRPARRAMQSLYAFARITDDVADTSERAADAIGTLADWRQSLQAALDGRPHDPVLAAVADVVQKFSVSPQHLFDIVDGVEQDLRFAGFKTFAELESYCHRVASSVGLACLKIWGVSDPLATAPARDCGVAFQLTNILRDLPEDAQRGRVYLPSTELEAIGVSVDCFLDDLLAGHDAPYFASLIASQVQRAEAYYQRGFATRSFLPPPGRRHGPAAAGHGLGQAAGKSRSAESSSRSRSHCDPFRSRKSGSAGTGSSAVPALRTEPPPAALPHPRVPQKPAPADRRTLPWNVGWWC